MERSGKREGLLEKTAEVFDLPGTWWRACPALS